MPDMPTQRGTLLKTLATPTTPKLLIDGDTFRHTPVEYASVDKTKDGNAKTVNITFQDPMIVLEFEATTITAQVAPVQGELVTFTFADASTVEMVCINPVVLGGFGKVQRASYRFEKPDVDLSP